MLRLYKKTMERRGYSENTIKNYIVEVNRMLIFFNNDISNLQYTDMLNYINTKESSTRTINSNLSAIRNFLTFLKDTKNYNIQFDFNKLYGKVSSDEKKNIVKEDVFIAFFKYLEEKEEYIQLAFKTLEDTGIRLSELTNLRKEDILEINGKAFLNIRDSKNRKSRIVPIFSRSVLRGLLKHTKYYIKDKIFYISNRGYQHYVIDFEKKYNMEINVHLFRHRFARKKLSEGMEIHILSRILGHSDISTTMLYLSDFENEILEMGVDYD